MKLGRMVPRDDWDALEVGTPVRVSYYPGDGFGSDYIYELFGEWGDRHDEVDDLSRRFLYFRYGGAIQERDVDAIRLIELDCAHDGRVEHDDHCLY